VLSGRRALLKILESLKEQKVNHIHLPAYLCASLLQPVQKLGFQYSFYPVDKSLVAHPDPEPRSAVLLIHYFGWINPAAAELRRRAGKDLFLIEDASQALLSDWPTPVNQGHFVMLSPRKFAPISLGGWFNGAEVRDERLPQPGVSMAFWRAMSGRLLRGNYLSNKTAPIDEGVETVYLDNMRSMESALDDDELDGAVPELALRLAAGTDWADMRLRRRSNWLDLRRRLGLQHDPAHQEMGDDVVPLGYVVRLANRDAVRARLAAQRIFCPVHWPLPKEVDPAKFPVAAEMSARELTLPVDQRYGEHEMDVLARALSEACQA
jgi:hypothetical protein